MLLGVAIRTAGAAPIDLQDRRELFVDRHLIDRLDNVTLQLAQPRRAEVVLKFEQPWEYAAGFVTVLKDGDVYRLYHRGGSRDAEGKYDDLAEITLYAESRDGIHWEKPALNLPGRDPKKGANAILGAGQYRVSHNFAPLLDARPGVPAGERYKAVGGKGPLGQPGGLYRYVSADGIHWTLYSEEPLFLGYALDSLNVLTWLPAEGCYAIYMRRWSEGGTPEQPKFKGLRTIARTTSKDFVHWAKPEPMDFGDAPPEHLYTNNTQPYFRAPHILVSMPFRFWPERQAYPVEQQLAWGVSSSQAKGISDAVFMTSRGGMRYDRTFLESFIRPGLDELAWHARETQPSNGIVQTGPAEMSFYIVNHYTLPTAHLTRYVLRLDGFASAHAGYTPGTLLTKPLTFRGGKLMLNFATSAAGSVQVEMLGDGGGVVASGETLIGDAIERAVTWRGNFDLGAWAGKPVRLRFTLRDADVYALRFAP
jgi:hypothetical protein